MAVHGTKLLLLLALFGLASSEATLTAGILTESEVEASEECETKALEFQLLQTKLQAKVTAGGAELRAADGDATAVEIDEVEVPDAPVGLMQVEVKMGGVASAEDSQDSKEADGSSQIVCTGDGTPNESDACKHMTVKSGCIWVPGCNWGGANAYGGWCTGSAPGCSYQNQVASCAQLGCSWVACPVTSLLSAEEREEVQASKSSQAPATSEKCLGDGTLNENPGCKYITSSRGCTYVPGCNWAGRSAFGGWCSGSSTSCAYKPHVESCSGDCNWVPSVDAPAEPVRVTVAANAAKEAVEDALNKVMGIFGSHNSAHVLGLTGESASPAAAGSAGAEKGLPS